MGEKILAVDLGAGSGRVFSGDFHDGGLHINEVHRFLNWPVNLRGDLLWDILHIYREIQAGLEKCIASCDPISIISVGVDAWGVDFALLDKSGRLADAVFHYRDQRTEGIGDILAQKMPPEELYQLTGTQFSRVNTLSQLVSLHANRPEVLERSRCLLMIGELMTYFLCGSMISEWTNATTSQMCGLAQRSWQPAVMEAFGLPPEIMPTVVGPGTNVGSLSAPWAKGAGLKQVAVVVPGVHDTASAVAAVPFTDDRKAAFISSGTWSVVGIMVEEPITTEEARRFNFANEGAVDGRYRFLRNVPGMWLLQQCLAHWQKNGCTSLTWDKLVHEGRASAPHFALLNPDAEIFHGEGDMPGRILTYLQQTGQRLPESYGEFVRIILESLALKYRWVLEKLAAITGRKIEVIHIVGGGSRNDLLNQMTADATGVPVEAGPAEATVTGNILVQAVTLGLLKNIGEGASLIRHQTPLSVFEPGNTDLWDEIYPFFLHLPDRQEAIIRGGMKCRGDVQEKARKVYIFRQYSRKWL